MGLGRETRQSGWAMLGVATAERLHRLVGVRIGGKGLEGEVRRCSKAWALPEGSPSQASRSLQDRPCDLSPGPPAHLPVRPRAERGPGHRADCGSSPHPLLELSHTVYFILQD